MTNQPLDDRGEAAPKRTECDPKRTPAREWIIQRCTQRWVGTELQYEDWADAVSALATPVMRQALMTRAEMLEALKLWEERRPQDEFRGHNVMNCACANHAALKPERS